MTHKEAIRLISAFYNNDNPTEKDKFLFVEAQLFLIDTYHNPQDMHNLAFYYLEQREFDLELKYLEMAAEYNYYPAVEELGYIWYYGQTGKTDYKKAFEYFSRGAESDDDVTKMSCEYKLADMYHNGFYVEKDEARYKAMIEDLYERIVHPEDIESVYGFSCYPFPEISYRLAGIRIEEGKIEEAMDLLVEAKVQLAENIRSNPAWWGNIEEMDNVMTRLSSLAVKSTALSIPWRRT